MLFSRHLTLEVHFCSKRTLGSLPSAASSLMICESDTTVLMLQLLAALWEFESAPADWLDYVSEGKTSRSDPKVMYILDWQACTASTKQRH